MDALFHLLHTDTKLHTHTHIYTYTCIRTHRHSLSGCAEFSTRNKRIRAISQRPPQSNRAEKPKQEEESNRTEPNGGRTRKRTVQRAEKRPNSPTFSHRLTAPKNRTEPNSKKKIPHAVCAQCAVRQTNRQEQTSRRTGRQADRQTIGRTDAQSAPARPGPAQRSVGRQAMAHPRVTLTRFTRRVQPKASRVQ